MHKMFMAVPAALAALAISGAFAQATGGSAATGTSGGSAATGTSGGSTAATTGNTGAANARASTGNKAAKGDKNGSISGSDRKFMEKAAAHGLAEVQMGQLAKERGMSDEVKSFGNRMVTDHSKANDELKALAASKGVSLPAEPDKKHKSKMDKMAKMQGPDFDRAYMKDMVKDHKDDVGDFRKEAKKAKDSELQAWANKTLPTLEEHLAMAQKTNDIVQRSKKTGDRETGSTKK